MPFQTGGEVNTKPFQTGGEVAAKPFQVGGEVEQPRQERIPLGQDIAKAIKETPTDIQIGTLNLGAGLLSAVKRRAVQLSGGGILPDDVVLRQFEAVKPEPVTQTGGILGMTESERIFRAPRLPGAIAAEAAGTVTRLPDIGSAALRSKAEKMQAEQDQVTLKTAPITRLHRAVVQGGVPSIGAAIGISLMTGSPLAGLAVLGESEGGAAFQEQLDKGASVRKASIIADLSEAAEIGGEMLVFPRILKGFKEGISIRKAFTIVAENATQEGITSFNQRFLEVFGTETSKGADKTDAAKLAFVEGVKAMPEGAFVGGAIGAGASVVGEVSNAVFGEGGEGFLGKEDVAPEPDPTGEITPEIETQETLEQPTATQSLIDQMGGIEPDEQGFRTVELGTTKEALAAANEIADIAEQQGFDIEIKTDANKLSVKEVSPTVGEAVEPADSIERETDGRQRDEERREELRLRDGRVESVQQAEEAEATLEAEKGQVLEPTPEPEAVTPPAKAMTTAQKLADQTGKTVYVKDGKVLVKKPEGEFETVGPKDVVPSVEGGRKLFHQTSKDAADKIRKEGFSLKRGDASRGDVLPLGINTKSSDKPIDVGEGKEEQLEIEIPASAKTKKFQNRKEVEKYLSGKSDAYYEKLKELKDIDRKYGKQVDDLIDFKEGMSDEAYAENLDKSDFVINEWKARFNIVGDEIAKIGRGHFLSEGIDAIEIQEDKGGVFGHKVTDNVIILNEKLVRLPQKPKPAKKPTPVQKVVEKETPGTLVTEKKKPWEMTKEELIGKKPKVDKSAAMWNEEAFDLSDPDQENVSSPIHTSEEIHNFGGIGKVKYQFALSDDVDSDRKLLLSRMLSEDGKPLSNALGEWGPVGEYSNGNIGIKEAYRGEGAGTAFTEALHERGLLGSSIGYSPSGIKIYKKAHKSVVQSAVKSGKPVPLNVLQEYAGEKWADDAIAKPKSTQRPTPVQKAKKTVKKETPGTLVTEKKAQETVAEVVDTDFTQPRDKTLTSARQAEIDETREDLGLDVIESQSKRGWKKAQTLAKKQNIARKADDIADEILENPVEDMGDVRTAGLTQRMAELKKEHKQLTNDMKAAKTDADTALVAAERERVLQKLDKLQRAVNLSGSEAGRRLAAQKFTLDENFDLASVIVEARSRKGANLTKKEEVNFERQTAQMEEMNKKIERLVFEMAELKAKKFVKRGRVATEFKRMTKAQKDSELAELIAKTNNLIKEGCAR